MATITPVLDPRLAAVMRQDRVDAARDYLKIITAEQAPRFLDSGDLTSAQVIAAAQIFAAACPAYIDAHLAALSARRAHGDASPEFLAAERAREAHLQVTQ